MNLQPRTSWQITKSVWYALFMRELLSRFFARRFAWFWLFVEPVLFVGVMVSIRSFIRVLDSVAGAEMIPWMVVGLSSFFMFRDGMMSSMAVVGGNRGLFAYRQVKPFDVLFVRALTQGVVHLGVIFILISGLALFGFSMVPVNILGVIAVWLSLWAMGLAVGSILMVVSTVVPEIRKVVSVTSLPLMILSGAFLPVHYMPHAVKEVLLWNPILHLIELLRLFYFEGYWTIYGINFLYPIIWIVCMLFVGLLLQRQYEYKLKMQ